MTTTTTPTGRDGIATGRYISLVRTAAPLAHLLPTSWPTGGRGRPTLCGERRMHWRPLELVDNPADYPACADCDAIAGDYPPIGAPVRIAPTATTTPQTARSQDRYACTPADPSAQPTPAERAARRANFLAESVHLSDRAHAWLRRVEHQLRTRRAPETQRRADAYDADPPSTRTSHHERPDTSPEETP